MTKEGKFINDAIDKREESLNESAEVLKEAVALMNKELLNKQFLDEWDKGKYFGIKRPISSERYDEFYAAGRSSDQRIKQWIKELQQRAGAYLEKPQPSMKMEDYVRKLFQGVIKAQRNAARTDTEGLRAKVLEV